MTWRSSRPMRPLRRRPVPRGRAARDRAARRRPGLCRGRPRWRSSAASTSVRIVGNEIAGSQTRPTTGILVAQGGIVDVEDNVIHSNRGPGINVATGYQLSDNTALDDRFFDCRDVSGPDGTGTAGTNNTWIANRGRTSSPAGLCVL